MRVYGQIYLY